MQQAFGRGKLKYIKSPVKRLPARVIAMSAFACTFGSGGVHAQAGQLGAYSLSNSKVN